jgi:Phage gp6-like head-tail connector protein
MIVPPLLTLEDAKVHLRITDTAHDADVQQKLTEAQDAIIHYLGEQVDPLWTETTVPPLVLSQIKIYLTHLYEDRGDDMSRNAAVWETVRRALSQLRLQAIGIGTGAA